MNVPKIRFNGFEEEWQENKLCDIARITMGQSPNSENYTNDSNDTLLIQGNADLNNGKVIPRLFTKQVTKTCDKNDIIMTVRAPVGDIAISDYNACIGRGVCSIKSSKFVYHYLDYLKMKDYWKKISKGSTIDSITSDDIKSLLIKTPNKKEEKKIIKTIDLINKKIELQSKKIEDLKLFKKGLINHIIKNIEIEKIPLKNILVEQNNKTSKNNEYEILSSTSKGLYLQKDYFNKQAASDNNVGYKILKKNQLVLSPQNLWMGNINVNTEYNIGIVSPSYKIFNISNNVNIDFFNYWIKSPKALFEYKISSEQGASIVRRNLNMDLFYEIIVDLPRGKLQNKVGKIIKLLNLNIQYNEFLLQKLLELKKGLMQNMFV